MIKHNCPKCGGFVTVSWYDPYDGYHRDLGVWRVGCRKCKIFVEDEDKLYAENKWNEMNSDLKTLFDNVNKMYLKGVLDADIKVISRLISELYETNKLSLCSMEEKVVVFNVLTLAREMVSANESRI